MSRSQSSTAISCTDLSFAWPDGAVVFDGLSFTAGPVRSGLVGRNGTGKSTLLRLIAGRLQPRSGTIRHAGLLGYLPQDLVLDTRLRVDQVLGIDAVRQAVAAIESGDISERNFAVVGDQWDVEDRALTTLAKLGLDGVGLDRTVGELSGGEGVLLGLAAELLRTPDVLLLDEPTNNLDLTSRRRLHDAVDSFRGALMIVSHDRELLDRVDQIGDLRDGTVTWCGERFRASLAALLLADPAPQLLMLDEPTNNLDLASVDQLASALDSYQGALVVASHDVPFLRRIGITRWLELSAEGLQQVEIG